HFAITIVDKALPKTLTQVRTISNNLSIPIISAKPSAGNPIEVSVVISTTMDTPGTPAIPLEATIKVTISIICCPIDMSIPYICATNNAAIDRYNAEPSRLKVYPIGTTNDVMSFGEPKFSIFFIMIGNTDSELDVENANTNSFFNILIIEKILIPHILATIPNTTITKNTMAPITTNNNFNNGSNAAAPKVIMVVQINANTPIGANFNILFIIQNIASNEPFKKSLTGCAFLPMADN